jgi:hypothetical protein
MNLLIRAIYRRMLLATILVLIAAVLCAVIYLRGGIKDDSAGYYGTVNPYKIDNLNATGNRLFLQNCAPCHHPLKDMTGPALANFDRHFPMKLFDSFLREPAKTIRKSPYLKAVKKTFGNIAHPAFSFSGADLDSLKDFLIGYKPHPVP